jgi:hypothetical protein
MPLSKRTGGSSRSSAASRSASTALDSELQQHVRKRVGLHAYPRDRVHQRTAEDPERQGAAVPAPAAGKQRVTEARRTKPARDNGPNVALTQPADGYCHVWTPLADQGLFLALRGSWERSCLRPHMRAPPSIVFCRWRSEVSSLSRRASLANLTSGEITIPATVPHSGRESFEGTAPLFKTTLGATPKIGDVPSDHRTAMAQCCPCVRRCRPAQTMCPFGRYERMAR